MKQFTKSMSDEFLTVAPTVDAAQPDIGDGPPQRIGVLTFAFAPILSGIASGAQCLLELLHDLVAKTAQSPSA